MEFTKDIQFNTSPTANKTVTVNYNGFLKDSSELTIVYGFGDAWENTTETSMRKSDTGFTAEIKLIDSDTFNFCFRNSENRWDNNSNCNYISPILPNSQENQEVKFDIDALIEEILQPIIDKKAQEIKEDSPIQINTQNIDLGAEITNILSQIEPTPMGGLPEYSTLDEILSGEIISETPVEISETNFDLFENENKVSVDEVVGELLENMSNKTSTIQQAFENIVEEKVSEIETTPQKIEDVSDTFCKSNTENALINVDDPFTISPRKLSKFYLFRKRLKLVLYKALVKLPQLIFGTQED